MGLMQLLQLSPTFTRKVPDLGRYQLSPKTRLPRFGPPVQGPGRPGPVASPPPAPAAGTRRTSVAGIPMAFGTSHAEPELPLAASTTPVLIGLAAPAPSAFESCRAEAQGPTRPPSLAGPARSPRPTPAASAPQPARQGFRWPWSALRSRLEPRPVQTELGLDRVQVARNDLSDSDLELVVLPRVQADNGAKAGAPAAESTAKNRTPRWRGLALRLRKLGATRS